MHALQKTHIRKGDTVVVIAGRDRGKSGKVLSVDRSAGKVVVEKLNMIKRHTKPNQKVKQGGILEKEAPLAISNVMFLCPVTQEAHSRWASACRLMAGVCGSVRNPTNWSSRQEGRNGGR